MFEHVKRIAGGLALAALVGALPAAAQEVDRMHFLIGSSPGSGWDQTARATGEALTEGGIVESASFENLPGGAGAKAVARLVETADRQENTMLVSSTPVLVYGIQGALSYSYKELTPIAAIIGDYGALAVRADSDIESFTDAAERLRDDPRALRVGGGSVIGSLDHLIAALAFKEAGIEPGKLNYIPYEGGGQAMTALLSGEIDILTTGLGEALEQARQGQVRIIGSTADEPVGDAPTFKEQGFDVDFVNWRGFFGAPGLDAERADAFAAALGKMYDTEAWRKIRERNGWVDLYRPRAEFTDFLAEQEDQVRALMQELGIETKS